MKRSFLSLVLVCLLVPGCTSRPDFATLERDLAGLAESFDGVVGIYVKDLTTGEEISILADSLFPTASMIKVPIMLTIFDRIDRGEILFQESFSLAGDLDEIMTRIVKIGTKGTKEILRSFPNDLKIKPQDNTMASYFRRRTPSMSKISHDDFSKYTAKEIYNKVRALQDPYPNAYVVCKDDTEIKSLIENLYFNLNIL